MSKTYVEQCEDDQVLEQQRILKSLEGAIIVNADVYDDDGVVLTLDDGRTVSFDTDLINREWIISERGGK